MTVRDIIVLLSQNAGLTQRDLAERLGYKSGANIAVPLSRDEGMGMRVDSLIRWLDALDAQIIIYGMNDEAEYVLDGESEGVSYK